jgi:hypothetical protein
MEHIEPAKAPAGDADRLPAAAVIARKLQVLGIHATRADPAGLHSGMERHADGHASRCADCVDDQLQLDAHPVRRRDDRPQCRLPGRVLRRRQRRRSAILQRVSGRRQCQSLQYRPRRSAVHLSRRQRDRLALFHLRPAEQERIAALGRHARAAAAEFFVGQPHQQQLPELRAAEHRVPEPEPGLEHGRLGEPDESLGRHTLKTGAYTQYSNKQQVQGGRPAGRA